MSFLGRVDPPCDAGALCLIGQQMSGAAGDGRRLF
jgi:hypothetical protein